MGEAFGMSKQLGGGTCQYDILLDSGEKTILESIVQTPLLLALVQLVF
jgi:hypothetical protein